MEPLSTVPFAESDKVCQPARRLWPLNEPVARVLAPQTVRAEQDVFINQLFFAQFFRFRRREETERRSWSLKHEVQLSNNDAENTQKRCVGKRTGCLPSMQIMHGCACPADSTRPMVASLAADAAALRRCRRRRAWRTRQGAAAQGAEHNCYRDADHLKA
jgi:hypothetical protein